MTTSHIIEGLLRCWRRGHHRAGLLGADLLRRYVRMMFADGDSGRPNCYEHYNPYTGRSCRFRGIDDYQHSWVLDLMARGIAGLQIGEDGAEVNPLPHELANVIMGPVRARGRTLWVEITESRVLLKVDGRTHEAPRGQRLRVRWRGGSCG